MFSDQGLTVLGILWTYTLSMVNIFFFILSVHDFNLKYQPFIFLYIFFCLTVFIVMHETQIQIVKNLARNVILIRALECPSYMPGQNTVQTQVV